MKRSIKTSNVSPLLYIIFVLETQEIWYPKRNFSSPNPENLIPKTNMNNTIGSSVQYNSQSHISFFSLIFLWTAKTKRKIHSTWKQHKQNLYWKPATHPLLQDKTQQPTDTKTKTIFKLPKTKQAARTEKRNKATSSRT